MSARDLSFIEIESVETQSVVTLCNTCAQFELSAVEAEIKTAEFNRLISFIGGCLLLGLSTTILFNGLDSGLTVLGFLITAGGLTLLLISAWLTNERLGQLKMLRNRLEHFIQS